ncbi:MAG: hypothetical protein Q9191_002766 [Dirinaria sp. TL-2023a]
MPSKHSNTVTKEKPAGTGISGRFGSKTVIGLLTLALAVTLFLVPFKSIFDNTTAPDCGALQDEASGIPAQDLSWLSYPDHYKVLSVPKDADKKAIKSAFNHKKQKWHPECSVQLGLDREILETASHVFANSRDVLSSRRQRHQYDSGSNSVKCDLGCILSGTERGERGGTIASINESLRAMLQDSTSGWVEFSAPQELGSRARELLSVAREWFREFFFSS